jgi:hypothetical protein
MRKLMLILALTGATLAGIPSEAFATPPTTGTFPIDETFIDDGASAACGFPVTSTITGSGRFIVFFDRNGNPIRTLVEESDRGTFSANGLSVNQSSHDVSTVNLKTGTETDMGVVIRVFLPNGRTLYSDRGVLVFDANGNALFEAGPHPSFHGDFPGLCAALTP